MRGDEETAAAKQLWQNIRGKPSIVLLIRRTPSQQPSHQADYEGSSENLSGRIWFRQLHRKYFSGCSCPNKFGFNFFLYERLRHYLLASHTSKSL